MPETRVNSSQAVPSQLGSLIRLPLAHMTFSAALDDAGDVQPVSGLYPKLQAHLEQLAPGDFWACAQDAALDAFTAQSTFAKAGLGSRWLAPGEALAAVVDRLTQRYYRLDDAALRRHCRAHNAALLAQNSNQGYTQKYEPAYYVRRRVLERHIARMLWNKTAPVLFVTAESGMGKTCFVRHLLEQLQASPRVRYIPLLVRGIKSTTAANKDGELDLGAVIRDLAHTLCGDGDTRGDPLDDGKSLDAVDAIERLLNARGQRLLLVLDGVNEADNSHAVFEKAREFLRARLAAAQARGHCTAFALLVTSRPDRFHAWSSNFVAADWRRDFPRIGQLGGDLHVKLGALSHREVDQALRKAELTDLPAHFRELLRDPLLLGFYRELMPDIRRGREAPPRTPLSLIDRHWRKQSNTLAELGAAKKLTALVREVRDICVMMVNGCQPTVLVKWDANDDVSRLFFMEAMIFERVRDTREQEVWVRFRYDRLAQLLIARFAILESAPGQPRTRADLLKLMVQLALGPQKDATLRESDVMRGSLIAALAWPLEVAAAQGSTVALSATSFDLALALLHSDHAAYAEVAPEVAQACQLALGEIVHAFLLHAAPWHGSAVEGFISAWFKAHPRDRHSLASGVLRRAVLDILRRNELGDCHNPASVAASHAKLCRLGARALLTDRTADSAVLLHALHGDGQQGIALQILKTSVEDWRLLRWGSLPAVRSLGMAFLLIAPESLADPAFQTCVATLCRRVGSGLLSMAAMHMLDDAMRKSEMPVCAEEWALLDNNLATHFAQAVRLLGRSGWDVPSLAAQCSVEAVLDLACGAKNGFITQLLTHALSCRIVTADDAARAQLLAEMAGEVDRLCSITRPAAEMPELARCEVGIRAYLLSLVCYHLLVFYAPLPGGVARLSAIEASTVLALMYRLAGEVLLAPAYLGRFRARPEAPTPENANIIGTLGRAALQCGGMDDFRALIRGKAEEAAAWVGADGEQARRYADFPNFLWEQLGIFAILARDAAPALDVIFEVAAKLGVAGFSVESASTRSTGSLKSILPAEGCSKATDAVVACLLKVRAVHPFAVEYYLLEHWSKEASVPLLNRLRNAAPVDVSRYLSWISECFSERAIAEQPTLVAALSHDMLANFNPDGLRRLAVTSMLRLSRWAQTYRPTAAVSVARAAPNVPAALSELPWWSPLMMGAALMAMGLWTRLRRA